MTIRKEELASVPESPGVYLFKEGERALYVGKAVNLKRRVLDHLQAPGDERHRTFLRQSDRIDYIVTQDERSALFLENILIKRLQPPYNILLKDDKTYPYIVLTTSEPFPRIRFTRRIGHLKDAYYGPFASAATARSLVKFVARHFQIRTCDLDLDRPLDRPCLYYHMGSCLGPCVPGLTHPTLYAERVREAVLFLSGRDKELRKEIRLKIERLARKQQFEEAAAYRDLFEVITRMGERRRVADASDENVDVIAHHRDRANVALVVLVFRKGLLVDKREYFWEGIPWREDFYDEVVPRFYVYNPRVASRVILDSAPVSSRDLEINLSLVRRAKVRVLSRPPGIWKERMAMAKENARLAFQRRFKGFVTPVPGLEELETLLKRPALRIIEAFDISHYRGRDRYGAMICFDRGQFVKKNYRTFRLESSHPEDDVAGMGEMVSRRYRRVADEGGSLPDLILIDGGPTQVRAASDALRSLNLSIPLVGLAKREEEIVFPGLKPSLTLSRSDPALQLLQRIRDEVHRFAITRHKKKRKKRTLASPLTEIPGIGEKTAKRLVKELGSVKKVKEAPVETLQALLGPARGLALYEALHQF
ncbi:MAG TPA: excinuclease ABC subunit UvrC [Thermoanaerobaculia bacterium]|nr:excinuclease ABC subunit UvrC [Thermoanaerobaculia bacterium]HUM30083.1 excinuclease ABC subunit UvrC [Thermoanaerobaculia bacterium]